MSGPEPAEIITDFYNDVQRLRRNFVNNPFQLENLTVINYTSQLFDGNIIHNIAKLESVGFMQLRAFINDKLISYKTLNIKPLHFTKQRKKPKTT